MDVVFLIIIGTVIALVLIYAIVSHKKRRANILELRRQIGEEQRQQELKEKCRPNTIKKRVSINQNQNENQNDDYYRLKELKEEQAAYDDFIASLDMK